MPNDDTDRGPSAASEEVRAVPTDIESAVDEWNRLYGSFMTDDELRDDEAAIVTTLGDANSKDARDLLASLIDATIWAERRLDEAKELKRQYDERRARYERRAENLRAMVERMMGALQVRRHRGKLATASIGDAPPSIVVTDEGQIPDEWFKVEKSLRRGDLRAHMSETGEIIPGVYLSNGGNTLTLRKVR